MPAVLVSVACSALATGVIVYVADRASTPPALIAPFVLGGVGPLFGAAGQWLPSFVHPFAFALLTAATRPRDASPACDACLAWWAVNVIFETGQHPQLRLLRGTFDVGDILAATLGAIAAAVVIRLVRRLEAHHVP